MKVLWLSHFVPVPPHGGSPQRVYNLIRELAKEFEVSFFGLDPRPRPPVGSELERDLDLLREICARVEYFPHAGASTLVNKGILFLRGLVSRTPVTTLRLISPRLRQRLREIQGETSFDLVHLETIDLVDYLPDCPDCPKILNHQNVESDLLLQKALSVKNPIERAFIRRQAQCVQAFEKRYCREVDCNFAVSEIDKARLEEISPGVRIEVIANGVDTDYFQPGQGAAAESPNTLLWVGGMTWFPNRDAVVFLLREIWPLIIRENKEAKLIIVGREPPAEWREAPGRDHIECPGFVPDVRPYLARASVFIVPIRYGGGTRLKVLDAMASGKAIVSTSVGSEGIAVENGRDLIMADTPAEFANAVGMLLRNGDERKRLGSAARRLVEESYSWPVIGENLRGISRGLIRERMEV